MARTGYLGTFRGGVVTLWCGYLTHRAETATGTAMTGTAWQRLAALDAYRVTQIPRRPDEGSPPFSRAAAGHDDGRAARGAVLTSAYHAAISGGADAGAHRRPRAPSPSAGYAPPRAARCTCWWPGAALRGSTRPAARAAGLAAPEVSLALPAGGKGQLIAPGGMAAAMNSLPCWTMIAGIADGLLAEDPGPPAARPGHPGGMPARRLGRPVRLAGPRRPAGTRPRSGGWPPRPRTGSGSPAAWPTATRTRRWRRGASRSGTPNCARGCRPACGGCTCWPARPTRKRPRGWPAWSVPPRIPAAFPTRSLLLDA